MLVSKWIAFVGLLGAAVASPDKSLAKRTTVEEVLADIEDATTCAACEVRLSDWCQRDSLHQKQADNN